MADRLTVTTGTTTTTADVESDIGAGIADHLNAGAALLWPLLLFCLLWLLRRELRALVAGLAARVVDKDNEIVLGPIVLRKIESRLESVELDQKVTSELVQRKVIETAGVVAASGQAQAIPEALRAMADAYLKVNIPDWNDRVMRKDELAGEMGLMVVRERIPRGLLAASKNEGVLVALASAIHHDPRSGDDLLIVEAGKDVQRLHVRYRFLMAIARLADRALVKQENRADLRALCLRYHEGADPSLQVRIKRTLAVLESPAARN